MYFGPLTEENTKSSGVSACQASQDEGRCSEWNDPLISMLGSMRDAKASSCPCDTAVFCGGAAPACRFRRSPIVVRVSPTHRRSS